MYLFYQSYVFLITHFNLLICSLYVRCFFCSLARRTNFPDVKAELDAAEVTLSRDKAELAAALDVAQRALGEKMEEADASTLMLQQNIVALFNVLRPLSFC